MAIEIQEKLQVRAPIDAVWQFVTEPRTVVVCMPGASLEEKIDDRNFIGKVKVKLGAITTGYEGKIEFTRVDDVEHVLEMAGAGKEKGGGTAKAAITIALGELPDGLTEMAIDAKVDLTGRVMQVGRGMIKGVSHQLFLQFADKAKTQLEAAQPATTGLEGGASDVSATPVPAAAGDDGGAVSVFALLGRTLWAAIVGFFKKLFGGSAGAR